jgi:hypothetical protein
MVESAWCVNWIVDSRGDAEGEGERGKKINHKEGKDHKEEKDGERRKGGYEKNTLK